MLSKDSFKAFLEDSGLSNGDVKAYLALFEEKHQNIKELVESRRVTKYTFLPSGHEIWVVLGSTDEYLVIPFLYCSCQDYHFNSVVRNQVPCCYHMVSQLVSEINQTHESFVKEDTALLHYLSPFIHGSTRIDFFPGRKF